MRTLFLQDSNLTETERRLEMPARQSRAKAPKGKALKKVDQTRKPSTANRATGRARLRSVPTNPTWKPVSKQTKNFVLNTFDSGIRLLMNKVPEKNYGKVHDALGVARNEVAVSLETLKVPPNKQDYDHLSATLVSLRESRAQLAERYKSLSKALDEQDKELQQLEDEKVDLQDFGKLPGKHHPLLVEPMEKELHLNFTTVR